MGAGVFDECSTDVQVWTARPSHIKAHEWPRLMSWLDERECDRMMTMHYLQDRQAYILAHALRRIALAEALKVSPDALTFGYTDQGQPRLVDPEQQTTYFSLSRSRTMVACAVTTAAPVGIDLELLDPELADLAMLSDFLLLPKADESVVKKEGDQMREFFFQWTVLEAYWKARGTGLSSSHPRILCRACTAGHEVTVCGDSRGRPPTWALNVQAPKGVMISVVLDRPPPSSPAARLTVTHRELGSVTWRHAIASADTHHHASHAC